MVSSFRVRADYRCQRWETNVKTSDSKNFELISTIKDTCIRRFHTASTFNPALPCIDTIWGEVRTPRFHTFDPEPTTLNPIPEKLSRQRHVHCKHMITVETASDLLCALAEPNALGTRCMLVGLGFRVGRRTRSGDHYS